MDRLKLRGTHPDIFGYTAGHPAERRLIGEYGARTLEVAEVTSIEPTKQLEQLPWI